MAKDLATVELSLRKVLEMDADTKSAAGTIPIIQELVPVFKDAGTLAEVGLAALVYSLSQTKVLTEDGEVKAKWEVTSLVQDGEGNWLPFSKMWVDFCYVHLGLDPFMASGYKRLWEVFAVNLGMGLDDLRAAGVHKLRLAVAMVDRLYPEIDLPLVEALFGNPDRCANCGSEVWDVDVGICPSCGEEFEPMPPGSIAAVALRIKQLKGQPEGVGKGFKVLPNVKALVEEGMVTGWDIDVQCWQEGMEGVSYLPLWSVSIIEDDAPEDEIGVRVCHIEAFRQWLARHFG